MKRLLPLGLLIGSLPVFVSCAVASADRELPPADKAAPTKIETATFAVG